jgi:hypothetical protein
VACRLKPLDRADYGLVGAAFTDEQWATLEQTFPDGVCDWSLPGRGQGPAETWLAYGDEGGGAIYGGRNLALVWLRRSSSARITYAWSVSSRRARRR